MTDYSRDWMLEAYCRGKGKAYDSDNRGGGQEEYAPAVCGPCKPHVKRQCAVYHLHPKRTPVGVIVCGMPFPENKFSENHREMMEELRRIAADEPH